MRINFPARVANRLHTLFCVFLKYPTLLSACLQYCKWRHCGRIDCHPYEWWVLEAGYSAGWEMCFPGGQVLFMIWLKCGISRLHFTQTSIQMWKWGGQTESDWSIKRHWMVFCRCQFVINAKWQDQRHIFETKKLLLEIITAKDSSGPWDHGVSDGWLIIVIEKPFARPSSTAKRHVYVFSVCLTWGKKLGGLKLLDCLTVWFKTKGLNVC